MASIYKKNGYRWVILISNTLLLTILSMGLTTWSVVIYPLSEAFNLGVLQTLFGASIFVLGYTIGSGIWGKLINPLGFKKTGIIGLICISIGQFAIPYVDNWHAVLALRFIMGMGLIVSPLSYINGIWFSTEQRGLATGIFVAAIPVGFALGGLWAGFLEPIFGWRLTFSCLAFLVLLGGIQWVLLTKNPPVDYNIDKKNHEEVEGIDNAISKKSVYGEKVTYFIALTVFANFFQIYGMNSIMAVYLETIGYSMSEIGILVFVLGIIGLISSPLGGIVSDKYVRKSKDKAYIQRAWIMAFGGFLISVIGCLLVPIMVPTSLGVAICGMVIVGWGIPWTNGPMSSIPIDIFGSEQGGEALGAMVLLGGAGGVISPLLIAWIGLNISWTYAWFVLGVFSALGMIACGLIATWNKN